MRWQLLVRSSMGRVLLVALVLAAGSIGFCLFDVDHHGAATHQGMPLDLCAGVAIFSVAVTLLVIAQVHPVPVDAPDVAYVVPLHRLDPPPKSASLS